MRAPHAVAAKFARLAWLRLTEPPDWLITRLRRLPQRGRHDHSEAATHAQRQSQSTVFAVGAVRFG